jgi:hypothetical protein
MNARQQVLILYLTTSSLDSPVIAWAFHDGTGRDTHMAGDNDEPPYDTGLDALLDGWRLLQMSPLLPHASGDEYDTSYLKYEFLFEKLIEVTT